MSVLLVVFDIPSNSFPHTTGMVVKEVGNGLYRRVGWFNNMVNVYRRAWPVTKFPSDCPESDGRHGRPLDLEFIKKTRKAWYNIFEVRELRII